MDKGCSWNTSACVAAARVGSTENLAFLLSNGCPWDEDTYVTAAVSNEAGQDILDYLEAQGLAVSPGARLLTEAFMCSPDSMRNLIEKHPMSMNARCEGLFDEHTDLILGSYYTPLMVYTAISVEYVGCLANTIEYSMIEFFIRKGAPKVIVLLENDERVDEDHLYIDQHGNLDVIEWIIGKMGNADDEQSNRIRALK
jgi:hypothetical protein